MRRGKGRWVELERRGRLVVGIIKVNEYCDIVEIADIEIFDIRSHVYFPVS